MTETPNFIADPPEFSGAADALSELLRSVGLHGAGIERHPPGGVEFEAVGRVLHIAEGSGTVIEAAGRSTTLDRGDLALLARGTAHRVASTSGWLTGGFAVRGRIADPVLAVLPDTIVVSAAEPGHDWLPLSLELLLAELAPIRPGGVLMISRVLDLLFVHALRHWASGTDMLPGRLTAALDPALSPVLSAIHREPGRPWTVTELAAAAGMSRTSFADCFVRRVGTSPAAYVSERRLEYAAHLLADGTDTVGRIAGIVGYESEAAFSRAFARAYGSPPGRWRKMRLPG